MEYRFGVKLLLRLALLSLFFALPSFAQVNVTGNLKDVGLSNVVSNVQVDFELENYGGAIPRISGTGTIVQIKKTFKPNASGLISGTLFPNSSIIPAGTYYRACIITQGETFRCDDYLINANFNLNNDPPLTVIPNIGPNQLITQTYFCPNLSASTIWTCTHNFNDTAIQVSTYDVTGNRIFPNLVTVTTANAVTITWIVAQAGYAVITHSGSIAIATNQPNALLQNPVGAQTIGGPSLTITAPLTVTGSLIGPLKTDPVSPLNGETWINGEAFKWQGNSGSPLIHTASTFLPFTCGANLLINALIADSIPGCVSPVVPQLTTLGDTLSVDPTPTQVRIPGNTTTTKQFYTQTGNGSISALPGWNPIIAGDVPPINLSSSANGGVTGNLPVTNLNGGTNADSAHIWRGDGVWAVINQSTLTDGPISGNVTINSTATNVKAVSVTFPSSGCPCRAFISYSLYLDFTGITNQASIDFWVDDGNSHQMAGVQTGQSNASTGAKTSATYGGFSSVTYNNSAGVTFTLKGIQSGAGGATVQASSNSGSGPNSDFQVTVIPSVN